MELLLYFAIFLNPILAIIFCLNLVEIIRKISANTEAETTKHTFWMTISLVYIVGTITIASIFAL
ncbi:hypothetical protein DS745_03370 [Anaerobacillus alkaliphilus]|uniref:PCZ2.2 n=1 Tax=Anaerobacillus alkaliphilus TaxID=1548597 RepID=A0A4Q0VY05_9BACI|nr:hypothetical protein [Anaerobacillus alkaliphilus]RXJ04439.1 hypothetical protein DS745_03370 [Anaerobacillus alkaliphilus]